MPPWSDIVCPVPLERLLQGEQTWVYEGVPGANIHVRPSRAQLRELLGCRQTTDIAINFSPPFALFGGVLPTGFPNYNGLMETFPLDSEAAPLRYEQQGLSQPQQLQHTHQITPFWLDASASNSTGSACICVHSHYLLFPKQFLSV